MPDTNLTDYFHAAFDDHETVARASRAALLEPFTRLVEASLNALRAGGKILIFGNGGSAADAQHIAAELAIRYQTYRDPIAAVALTTDTSALTAAGNDYSFDEIFARQVAALGRREDLALGISTSGKSPNVLRGLQAAQEMGMVAAAFAGRDGGDLVGLADPILIVPSNTTSRIQEIHIALGHMLCGTLEQSLDLV